MRRAAALAALCLALTLHAPAVHPTDLDAYTEILDPIAADPHADAFTVALAKYGSDLARAAGALEGCAARITLLATEHGAKIAGSAERAATDAAVAARAAERALAQALRSATELAQSLTPERLAHYAHLAETTPASFAATIALATDLARFAESPERLSTVADLLERGRTMKKSGAFTFSRTLASAAEAVRRRAGMIADVAPYVHRAGPAPAE